MLEKFKVAVGLQEQEQKGLIGQIDETMTMSLKNRLIAFGCCFAFGCLLTIISIPMLWTLQITKFAILYSVGSVISVMSTLFLMGKSFLMCAGRTPKLPGSPEFTRNEKSCITMQAP